MTNSRYQNRRPFCMHCNIICWFLEGVIARSVMMLREKRTTEDRRRERVGGKSARDFVLAVLGKALVNDDDHESDCSMYANVELFAMILSNTVLISHEMIDAFSILSVQNMRQAIRKRVACWIESCGRSRLSSENRRLAGMDLSIYETISIF
jgi:hypothetical protein